MPTIVKTVAAKKPAKKPTSLLGKPSAEESRKPAANRVGRPSGRDSQQTRVAILDVAESLFSERGYEGASIRDIASGCDMQAAAIGYHYASKLDLFNAVVARRALIINEARSQALNAALIQSGQAPLSIDVLVTHYVEPFLEATSHGDPGWRNFASLMGRLANSPRGTEMINQHYQGVANQYLAEFKRTLPGMPAGRLADGFLYMVSAMLIVCADTGRWEAMVGLAGTQAKRRKASAILADLVPFVAGGFRAWAPVEQGPSPVVNPSPQPKRSKPSP
jgi:AcrR family transcriptional regulator